MVGQTDASMRAFNENLDKYLSGKAEENKINMNRKFENMTTEFNGNV